MIFMEFDEQSMKLEESGSLQGGGAFDLRSRGRDPERHGSDDQRQAHHLQVDSHRSNGGEGRTKDFPDFPKSSGNFPAAAWKSGKSLKYLDFHGKSFEFNT